ncbi:MAG: phospholipase [Proteobacteria bacterium]|nr:MAG: phospholipase [Pseudomonadota bacterium]PIE40035.1 MAG: phospholipase [Gammaproteobacteria bacterium]
MRVHPCWSGLFVCLPLMAAAWEKSDKCVLDYVASAENQVTVEEVKRKCDSFDTGVQLPERLLKEKATEENNFVITPHRQNYILPFTNMDKPNQAPYTSRNIYPDVKEPIQKQEAKLQISLKVPLTYMDLLTRDDGIYFGFTLKSFWQVYNSEISAPFRETNYQPEIFYQAAIPSNFLGGVWFTRIGLEHQSNGRSQYLSRSWNRVFAGLGFQRNNWVLFVQPWYRLEEKEKYDDGDPLTPPQAKGDDNPDISDYMGHFEFMAVFKQERMQYSALTRFSPKGKGALELDMSFPLWGRLKGYVQYFNGYGESLIDYNHRVQRIGLGVLLTDIL